MDIRFHPGIHDVEAQLFWPALASLIVSQPFYRIELGVLLVVLLKFVFDHLILSTFETDHYQPTVLQCQPESTSLSHNPFSPLCMQKEYLKRQLENINDLDLFY